MKPENKRFIVVSGLPASGKSTVARVLGALMNLPVIDKDVILERLFEEKGIGDGAWRRQLSRESDVMLQQEAAASNGAVVSSFWHVADMPSESGTPSDWLHQLPGALVNVHCVCPPELAAARFASRDRHPGHLDKTRAFAEILASIQALLPSRALGIGELVVVDTTEPVVAAAILHDVEAGVARCLTRADL